MSLLSDLDSSNDSDTKMREEMRCTYGTCRRQEDRISVLQRLWHVAPKDICTNTQCANDDP